MTAIAQPAQWRGMTTFLIIWFGQLISNLGSSLTSFALGVHIYQRTGSATQLGLSLLAATLPSLLVTPIAGALVDRWDRRGVMIASDTGAAFVSFTIWALLFGGQLQVWHIYIANAVNALFRSFQEPAHMASITQLVPKEHYGRASGLGQLSQAINLIISPTLAGLMMITIQIQGVILIDLATFIFAVLTLLMIQIPKPPETHEGKAARGSLLQESVFGLAYLRERPGLLGMLILFAFVNFSLGFHSALFTPLILSFTTPAVLGSVLSVGGLGLFIGSIGMSTWGGAKRKINSLMASLFSFGLFVTLAGVRADPFLIAVASAGFFALLPIANGSSQAIWQAKVAPDLQGRIFATRRLIAQIASPLAYVLAGPLADQIFEPILAAGGMLADNIGQMIGVGAGRGIGLIFVMMGLFIALTTAIAYLNPRIRHVETELPDFVAR